MPNDLLVRHLCNLIALREAALKVDDGWKGYDGVQSEQALWKLETIQDDILKSDFSQPHAMALGLALLLDSNDEPNFADDFKNQLFTILRRTNEVL